MFDLKSLVNSLVNWNEPRSTTALSATQLVKNLPQAEYFRAQVEIVKAVSRMNEDPDIALKELITTLLYVDERAHSIHRQLTSEYLQGQPHSKAFLPVILAYQHEFSKAYQTSLQLYIDARATNLQKEIQMVALRGMYHFTRQIFWDAIRYTETAGQIWKQCYRFYRYFEQLQATQLPLQIYQDDEHYITAEQLLLSACMLDLSYPSHLETDEICAADRLVPLLAVQQRLTAEPQQNEPEYVINLDSSHSPQPMRRTMVGKRFRYFSTQPLISTIDELKAQLEGEIPSILQQCGPSFPIAQWRELLGKLETQWLFDGKGSRRKAERIFTAYDVKVAVGFKQIAFQAKMHGSGLQEDDSLRQWKVTDMGDDSLSLVYLGADNDNLRLGNLLLIQPDDDAPSIGLIKRLMRQAEGGAKLGVDIIGQAPVGVTLSDLNGLTEHPISALYITQSNSNNASRWFLLPTGYAKPGREAILTVQGKSYHIRLKGPFSEMDGCVNGDFDTLAKID